MAIVTIVSAGNAHSRWQVVFEGLGIAIDRHHRQSSHWVGRTCYYTPGWAWHTVHHACGLPWRHWVSSHCRKYCPVRLETKVNVCKDVKLFHAWHLTTLSLYAIHMLASTYIHGGIVLYTAENRRFKGVCILISPCHCRWWCCCTHTAHSHTPCSDK